MLAPKGRHFLKRRFQVFKIRRKDSLKDVKKFSSFFRYNDEIVFLSLCIVVSPFETVFNPIYKIFFTSLFFFPRIRQTERSIQSTDFSKKLLQKSIASFLSIFRHVQIVSNINPLPFIGLVYFVCFYETL